ncbi:MAG: DNA polymerase I [Muribaculaceae bacterium]|nr:DNA polymerase I [Muribaculaceae bacterium]
MEDKRLYLLDAYALIFRAYYALMRNPRFSSKGVNTSAIFGFVNILQDLLKHRRPTHIAVCFDPPGGTFRHEAYEQYKANRDETPEGIKEAVPYIKRILEAYRIPIYVVPGYEADDVIGTLAHKASQAGFTTYMVTGDKDFGQLVDEHTVIFNPGKNEQLGVDEIKAKYGIDDPRQVIDILGLMGDSADNIPGCPGVGPKTAEKLVQQYGSIERLLESTSELKGSLKEKVEANAEQIRFSKFLATIKTDVPIEFDAEAMQSRPFDADALRSVFNELEFRTLTARIIDQGTSSSAPAQPAQAKPASQQPSLFDFDNPEPESSPAPPARTSLQSHEYSYQVIADPDQAATIVARLLQNKQVAVHIVAEGDEAMTAQILGYALAGERYHAYYLPHDGFGMMTDAVRPLFENTEVRIVSNDVKRDMVMLHNAGVKFNAPYYDTSVAHYLLQPERTHGTAVIAQEMLHYDAIDPETVLGPKGRNQKKLHELTPQALCDMVCELADVTLALPQLLDEALAENKQTHLLTDMELPLIEVLASMEIAGARIDVKALNDYSVTLTKQMNELEQTCYELAGTQFNTASPAQVGEILFDRLHLDDKAKKTKTGQYSTTEEVLLKLRDRHPLVDKILQLRGIRKLLSTYVNALPSLINKRTGRIHTTYNQTVTATGRLSSTNPNLQNIPVRNDEGREIRKAFIPAPGNVFFSADYSQIELRLVADLSQDNTMLDAFKNGHDIHAITAAKIFHERLEDVTSDQRRKAKTANFGILYGISAFGLSERLSIPRAEAKMLIDGYFETFPQVRAYIDRSIAQAKEKGYVTTLYGRRRMLPDINSRNAVVRSFSERNAINAPIQGTAADIIKIAMINIYRRFKQEGIQSKMILQVHDELNFDVMPAELEQVSAIVVQEMENAYKGVVSLTASHGMGANWLDAH